MDIRKLTQVDEIEPLFEASHETPVLVFKHSLTCPISSMAYRELERYLAERGDDASVVHTLIEIQNARPVSVAIAERTGIRHESPQALLIKDGEVVWHDSHNSIRSETLKRVTAS